MAAGCAALARLTGGASAGAGAVQGEALVLPVAAAGDQGPLMISPSISRATTSPAGAPAQRPGSSWASP